MRPSDTCPLRSAPFECAPNSLTATTCACDQGVELTNNTEGSTEQDAQQSMFSTGRGMLFPEEDVDYFSGSASGILPPPVDEIPPVQTIPPTCLCKYYYSG